MKCLLLAGGFGRRLNPEITIPKAMLPYRGRPLIDHIIARIPPELDIFISTNGRFAPAFSQWQKERPREVEIWVEAAEKEEEKLGAVSALQYWIKAKALNEDLLVIAADNYFEFSLPDFIKAGDGRHTLLALHDIHDVEKAKQFGVVLLEGNRVTAIEEKPALPRSTLIATACYVFPQRVLPFFQAYCQGEKRDNLGSFISFMVHNDVVYGYQFTDAWFDIGSEKDIIQAYLENVAGEA